MYRILFLLVIIVLAIVLGLLIHTDPGYVLISYDQWSLEMPLWLLLLAWFASLGICVKVIKSGYKISNFPKQVHQWYQERRQQKANLLLNRGLLSFIEGHWLQAERALQQSAAQSPEPVVNLMVAAFAASQLGRTEESSLLLKTAKQHYQQHHIIINLVSAYLALQQKNYDKAQAELSIAKQTPSHPLRLRVLYELYLRTENWQALKLILPQLQQQPVIASADLDQTEYRTYRACFAQTSQNQDQQQLDQIWSELPNKFKHDTEILACYVRRLLHLQADVRAEIVLRKALKQQWQPRWIQLYGQLQLGEPQKPLKQAETWLRSHPDDPDLLLCLGHLAWQNKLWGKAKQYFTQSLAKSPQIACYQALAKLCLQQNDTQTALDYLLTGLDYAKRLTGIAK